jgi:hypothetical protein
VTLDCDTADAGLKTDPSQRLTAPMERELRTPSAGILAACLAAHALLLAILILEDFSVASEPTRAEEIPVEIVAELPPELNAFVPPPDLATPPAVKEKPPPQNTQLDDVAVAHDAPVSGNNDQTRKGEPDRETKAPRAAPPPKLAARQAAQESPEQEKAATASKEKEAKPSPPAEPQKLRHRKTARALPPRARRHQLRNSLPLCLPRPIIQLGPWPRPRRSAAAPKRRVMSLCFWD